MTNAASEFVEHIAGRQVLCALITYGNEYNCTPPRRFNLPRGYLPAEGRQFVADLNFEYDSGFGGQNLFGTIWYTDGTWSSRDEYDGSEWWQHNVCPPIPGNL